MPSNYIRSVLASVSLVFFLNSHSYACSPGPSYNSYSIAYEEANLVVSVEVKKVEQNIELNTLNPSFSYYQGEEILTLKVTKQWKGRERKRLKIRVDIDGPGFSCGFAPGTFQVGDKVTFYLNKDLTVFNTSRITYKIVGAEKRFLVRQVFLNRRGKFD